MTFCRQLYIFFALGCWHATAQCSQLIPVPTSCSTGDAEHYDFWPASTTILYDGNRASDDTSTNLQTPAELAAMLNDELTDFFGMPMDIAPMGENANVERSISLILDPTLEALGLEGYTLTTSTDDVTIKARAVDGLFYGTRTFLQAIRITSGSLQAMEITDVPKTTFLRGHQLDAARKYHTVPGIKNLIRRMSWMKLNTLFWHAADAESFRLAVFEDEAAYGPLYVKEKSYSIEEIADLVAFAQRHSVQIVPGIEFPGHNSVFNEYFGTGLGTHCGPEAVEAWQTPNWVTDMTNPDALEVAKMAVTKVAEHFPSEYFHVGADELPMKIVNCLFMANYLAEREKTLGDLIIEFVNELAKTLKAMGKKTIIYNGVEHMEHTAVIDKEVIVQIWAYQNVTTPQTTLDALKDYQLLISTTDGGKITKNNLYLTPNQHHHLYPSSKGLAESWDINKAGDTDLEFANVIGYGLLQWGDYIYWGEDAYFDDLANEPRAIMSHRLWSSPEIPSKGALSPLVQAMQLVGEPPFFEPYEYPSSDFRRLHYYDFEDYDYPEGQFRRCPDPHCRFVKDLEGDLNGSTYALYVSHAVPCDSPRDGLCLAFNEDRDGFGLAGKDLPTPWTLGMWLNINETNPTGGTLMNSPFYGIMLNTPDSDKVTLTKWDGEGIYNNYWPFENGTTSDKHNQWIHLALTANATHTDLYIDGDYVDSLRRTIHLPMGAFGGWAPPTAAAATGIRGLLDDVVVYAGFANADRIAEIMRSTTPDASYSNILSTGFLGIFVLAMVASW